MNGCNRPKQRVRLLPRAQLRSFSSGSRVSADLCSYRLALGEVPLDAI
jgi:hypothetical protein